VVSYLDIGLVKPLKEEEMDFETGILLVAMVSLFTGVSIGYWIGRIVEKKHMWRKWWKQ